MLLTLATAAPASLLAQVATARTSSEAPIRVTSVEGLTEYRLANGLRVLLFPDASKPTITVNITYFVGSRHEGYGESGMAHLLEHLVFKGTPSHPRIDEEFTARGARWNGTTWYDRTNYFELLPARDDALEWAVDLESDRMVNSFISADDLASEMTVVRNEFESGENSPFRILQERLRSTAYLWHGYGRSTIGARSDLENVPIERLQAFYRRYYQPDNALLVISGKFDEARALELVQEKFGRIPAPQRTLAAGNLLYPTYTREPVQDGERLVTLRRVGDVQLAAALYHVPAAAHPDFPAVQVLASVLGSTPSGRLYRSLVEPQLATMASAFAQPLREPGNLVAMAQVRQEAPLEPAQSALVRTLEEFAASEVTAEEVERAKTALGKNMELALNDPEQIGLQLTEWEAAGDWRLMFYLRDRIAEVTPDDVRRVAATYLKPANRTVALFLPTTQPDRAEITEAPEPTSLLEKYTGRAAVAAGEAFDPSPSNIEQRTTRTTLPNGFELALLPKKTRGENVQVSLVLRYGSEQTLTNRTVESAAMRELLMRGTRTKTREQIKDAFDQLKAQVFVNGASNNLGVVLQTTRPNLMPALALVREVLQEPAFSATELELLRQERLSQLEAQASDPGSLAGRTMSRHMSPYPKGHPLYVGTTEEDLSEWESLTPDAPARFYRELVGVSNATMAVVGDFDPEEVTAFVAEAFGEWQNPQPFTRMPYEYHDVPPKTEAIETPDKPNAVILYGLNLELQDTDPDWPALYVANYIFGGSGLDARIADRIRQREGISYGVGSSVLARALDRSGAFQVYAIFAPENASRLEEAFREELDRALRDGFTEAELVRAKSGIAQVREQSRAQDGVVASALQNGLYLDRTYEFESDFESKLEALNLENVNAAFRKYIDPERLTMVKAGYFSKSVAAPRINP